MLMKALKPALPASWAGDRQERRRPAQLSLLPTLRRVTAKPTTTDYLSAYPCTRMHGAAFESEFYSQDTVEPVI